MNENYIAINGKKIELTEEQLKQLGIEPEKKRKNPFERVPEGEVYFLAGYDKTDRSREANEWIDEDLFAAANYFNDEAFAKQVALHQLLYRKLLKFAYDNECEDTAEWNEFNPHWTIRYSGNRYGFSSYSQARYKARDIYFSSEKGAERAIHEIVVPFMKEHPDFVW